MSSKPRLDLPDRSYTELPAGVSRREVSAPLTNAPDAKAEWLICDEAGPEATTVLYVYGSTFLMNRGPMHTRLAAECARQVAGRAYLFDYALAPEKPFPLAIQDVVEAYRSLLAQGLNPKSIVMFADGAGAAIALGALSVLRDAGDNLPAGLGLLCPWADLTFSSGSYVRDIKHHQFATDFEILVELSLDYLQGADPHNPLASPIFASLDGLPPTLIHTSLGDPCCDDGKLISLKMQEAGGIANIHVWDSLPWSWHRPHALIGQAAAVVASFGQFFRRVTPQSKKQNAAEHALLTEAYKIGVSERIEPHMEKRLDEIMLWAQQQGPGWVWSMIGRRVEHGALVTQENVEREWLFSLFDQTSFPMLILAPSRHVIIANKRANDFLRQGSPLHIRNGTLSIKNAGGRGNDDRKLIDAFATLFAPIESGKPVGTRRTAFRLRDKEAEMHVQCFRLSPSREDAAAPPIVLMRVIPADFQQTLDESLLRDTFGLSVREANLAAAFATGVSLDEYCRQNDLAMPTVRTHFARIKSKLAARDQASVVRILLAATTF